MTTAEAPRSGVRLLFDRLRPARRLLVPASLLATAAAACEIVPYWLVYRMAETAAAAAPDVRALGILAGLILAAALIRLLLFGTANVLSHRAAFRIQADLRIALLRALHRRPFATLEGRTGDLKKTVVDDVGDLEHLVAHTLPDAVAGLVAPVLAIPLLLTVDWRMALASIALVPVAFLAQRRAFRGMDKLLQRWHGAEARTNAGLLAYVQGIATLKAYNRAASSFDALRRDVHALAAVADETTRRTAVPYALFFVALSTNLLLVLPTGLALHLAGGLDAPALVLFALLGAGLTQPLLRVAHAFAGMQRQLYGCGRIAAVLDAPPVPQAAGFEVPEGSEIRLEGVGFHYAEGWPVLRELTLTVPAGRVTALVGPSGAGKSTLARLVARFADVQSGSVRIGGVDVRRIDPERLRALVAVVFQDPYLFHGSLRDNIRLARPDAPASDFDAAVAAAGLSELAARLPQGLDSPIGERGGLLSGGERQRVAIARALLKDAPILVLDEATAFADPEGERAVQLAIARLTRGRTVLVVAHRLATVTGADRIAVLAEGRLDGVGRHDELLDASPVYRRLWSAQQQGRDWVLAR